MTENKLQPSNLDKKKAFVHVEIVSMHHRLLEEDELKNFFGICLQGLVLI